MARKNNGPGVRPKPRGGFQSKRQARASTPAPAKVRS
jgi:hypothetical protein